MLLTKLHIVILQDACAAALLYICYYLRRNYEREGTNTLIWTIQKREDSEYLYAISTFLLDFFSTTFGRETMFSEECLIYNDDNAETPMLVTNTPSLKIRLCQSSLVFWAQTIFQLSHELCHYAIRQHKEDIILDWYEETVCEAMSLYSLEYSAKNWHLCTLSQIDPSFDNSIAYYLDNELSKNATSDFANCDNIASLSYYERNGSPEKHRSGHRYERNRLFHAIHINPEYIHILCDYTSYLNEDGLTIDFTSWQNDVDNPLLRVLREIQPLEESMQSPD